MTYQERLKLAQTVYDDMVELLRTDETIRERLKTQEVATIYDLLRSIFFGEDNCCIYDEGLSFVFFNKRYGTKVRSRIKYHKNKLLGIKTSLPDNFCVGIVFHGHWNWFTNTFEAGVEMVPFPERMTYFQARRKVFSEMRKNGCGCPVKYVIYRIEDDGKLTLMDD